MAKLYIPVGIPGVGKTTLMKKIKADYHSSDDIRNELYGDSAKQTNHKKVFAILDERVLNSLNNGNDVVYDATNVTKKIRKDIITQYKDIASEIICVFFDVPFEIAEERNNSRERVVPLVALKTMYKRLSENLPEIEEGFDELVYIIT